jgi:hypothetical protein
LPFLPIIILSIYPIVDFPFSFYPSYLNAESNKGDIFFNISDVGRIKSKFIKFSDVIDGYVDAIILL